MRFAILGAGAIGAYVGACLARGGADVTLWDATDATRIPQAPMVQHFNLWAPGIHWSSGQTAPPPAHDASFVCLLLRECSHSSECSSSPPALPS